MISVAGDTTKLARQSDPRRVAGSASGYGNAAPSRSRDLAALLAIRGPIGGASKRAFDAFAAGLLLTTFSPLLLLMAAAIKLHDGGPVLYRHRRVGRNCTAFSCIKFRTMVVDAEPRLQRHLHENPAAAREWQQTQKLKHDPRITSLGAVLRKTSLDELPQLLNIVKGEMSFVGPRPIVRAEIGNYGAAIVAYFRARPGLTGPWQVSGRNDVSYDTRVALDQGYVEAWSFAKDVKILLKTFGVVLSSRGCY